MIDDDDVNYFYEIISLHLKNVEVTYQRL